MKRLVGSLIVLAAMAASALAQAEMPKIPKVLVIYREFTKPGRAGSPHEKTESLFVQASQQAKDPEHYLAFNSLNGKNRSLFIMPFDSFADWEKSRQFADDKPAYAAALDRAAIADGAELESADAGTFAYVEEYSLRPTPPTAKSRYLQIEVFKVRTGHESEWAELVKMARTYYGKAAPQAHWTIFAQAMGTEDRYLATTFYNSLAEFDEALTHDAKAAAEMGPEVYKKFEQLMASSVESAELNVFSISPKMSYPWEEWVKADPDFWRPKTAAKKPAAPAAAKPAAQ